MTTKTTSNKAPIVEITWRDENYGSVYAVAVFRNYAGSFD